MIQHLVMKTIPPHLLRKKTVIYVRVSTPGQKISSTASLSQQYGLKQLAIAYGFPPENITILDADLGRTAKTLEGRYGFQSLLQEVATGQIGAIFCLDSSRLARMSSDGKLLIRLCEINGVLIIDKHSIHDPRNHNDKTFLTLKTAVDEIEHSTIKDRLLSALEHKSQKGEVPLILPVGYLRDKSGKAIIDPNSNVADAVREVFVLFDRLGSIHAVVKYMNERGKLLPNLIRSSSRKGEYDWGRVTVWRLASMYHNPTYAGAYVRGQTQNKDFVITDGIPRIETRRVKVSQEEWYVCILGAHEGYITWEKYQQNQRLLLNNQNLPSEEFQGAVRSGGTLLQGVLICGKCEHKLSIQYRLKKKLNKKYPTYVCGHRYQTYADKYCQYFPSHALDQAVAEQLLLAFTPANLEISIEDSKRIEQYSLSGRKDRERGITRARQEADKARDRYMMADYKNRLVADKLEAAWNEKLAELRLLEQEHAEVLKKDPRLLTKKEHEQLLELAKDLPRLWHSDKMDWATRKRLLRTAIEKVIVNKTDLSASDYKLDFIIFWKTGARQSLSVTITRWKDLHSTDPDAAALIRKLAPTHTYKQIAYQLNQQGFKPKYSSEFTRLNVLALCKVWRIKAKSFYTKELRDDGLYRTRDVAKILNQDRYSVWSLCATGKLNAHRDPFDSYHWLIRLTPEDIRNYKKSGR